MLSNAITVTRRIMRGILKLFIAFLIIFGWLLPQSDTLLPVDLIRVVFLAPSTLILDTPSISWLAVITTLKVLALSFWLGLPRIPQRRPVRYVMQDESYNDSGSWIPLDTSHMALYLDVSRSQILSLSSCHESCK